MGSRVQGGLGQALGFKAVAWQAQVRRGEPVSSPSGTGGASPCQEQQGHPSHKPLLPQGCPPARGRFLWRPSRKRTDLSPLAWRGVHSPATYALQLMHWRAGTLSQDGQQEKGEQKYLFVPLIFQTISTCKGPLTSVLRLCTPPQSSLSPEGFKCHHPDQKGIESRSHSFRNPHLAAALCHVGSVKVAGTSCSIWSLKPE